MSLTPFVTLLLALPLAPQSRAQQPQARLAALSDDFEALVEQVDPAVVQILTRGLAPAEEGGVSYLRPRSGSGSGVIVDPAGYILTNAHVVGNARRVHVLIPRKAENTGPRGSILKAAGTLLEAEVLGTDRETDLAVLRVPAPEGGLPALSFGDSEALRQGQLVFAFGSPYGLENSVTMGIISSVARQVRPDDPMIYLQTDAAINPGNSGGPLVDTAGRLVGINTFIVSSSGGNQGVGFAAPANIARSVYEQIRAHGRVRRGQIGVMAQTISPGLARALSLERDHGVILSDVAPSSAAESAGLEAGDIVLALDGKPMENARQFGVNIYRKAGESITLDILRGKRRLQVTVAVLERPRDPDRLLSLASADSRIDRLGIIALELDARVFAQLPPLRRLSGVLVAGLTSEPPSASGEPLLTGDVIYAVNGQPVSSPAELRRLLAVLQHGDPVALHVERGGQLLYLLLEVD